MLCVVNHYLYVVEISAYVSGEMSGLVKESPYFMGDTLNGRPGLDIDLEKKLIEEKLDELKAEGAMMGTIKISMRNMGLERYVCQTKLSFKGLLFRLLLVATFVHEGRFIINVFSKYCYVHLLNLIHKLPY